jgi:ribonuclease HI
MLQQQEMGMGLKSVRDEIDSLTLDLQQQRLCQAMPNAEDRKVGTAQSHAHSSAQDLATLREHDDWCAKSPWQTRDHTTFHMTKLQMPALVSEECNAEASARAEEWRKHHRLHEWKLTELWTRVSKHHERLPPTEDSNGMLHKKEVNELRRRHPGYTERGLKPVLEAPNSLRKLGILGECSGPLLRANRGYKPAQLAMKVAAPGGGVHLQELDQAHSELQAIEELKANTIRAMLLAPSGPRGPRDVAKHWLHRYREDVNTAKATAGTMQWLVAGSEPLREDSGEWGQGTKVGLKTPSTLGALHHAAAGTPQSAGNEGVHFSSPGATPEGARQAPHRRQSQGSRITQHYALKEKPPVFPDLDSEGEVNDPAEGEKPSDDRWLLSYDAETAMPMGKARHRLAMLKQQIKNQTRDFSAKKATAMSKLRAHVNRAHRLMEYSPSTRSNTEYAEATWTSLKVEGAIERLGKQQAKAGERYPRQPDGPFRMNRVAEAIMRTGLSATWKVSPKPRSTVLLPFDVVPIATHGKEFAQLLLHKELPDFLEPNGHTMLSKKAFQERFKGQANKNTVTKLYHTLRIHTQDPDHLTKIKKEARVPFARGRPCTSRKHLRAGDVVRLKSGYNRNQGKWQQPQYAQITRMPQEDQARRPEDTGCSTRAKHSMVEYTDLSCRRSTEDHKRTTLVPDPMRDCPSRIKQKLLRNPAARVPEHEPMRKPPSTVQPSHCMKVRCRNVMVPLQEAYSEAEEKYLSIQRPATGTSGNEQAQQTLDEFGGGQDREAVKGYAPLTDPDQPTVMLYLAAAEAHSIRMDTAKGHPDPEQEARELWDLVKKTTARDIATPEGLQEARENLIGLAECAAHDHTHGSADQKLFTHALAMLTLRRAEHESSQGSAQHPRGTEDSVRGTDDGEPSKATARPPTRAMERHQPRPWWNSQKTQPEERPEDPTPDEDFLADWGEPRLDGKPVRRTCATPRHTKVVVATDGSHQPATEKKPASTGFGVAFSIQNTKDHAMTTTETALQTQNQKRPASVFKGELYGIIHALLTVPMSTSVHLLIDSEPAIKVLQKLVAEANRGSWPSTSQRLKQACHPAVHILRMLVHQTANAVAPMPTWEHVKSHIEEEEDKGDNHKMNERADELANEGRRRKHPDDNGLQGQPPWYFATQDLPAPLDDHVRKELESRSRTASMACTRAGYRHGQLARGNTDVARIKAARARGGVHDNHETTALALKALAQTIPTYADQIKRKTADTTTLPYLGVQCTAPECGGDARDRRREQRLEAPHIDDTMHLIFGKCHKARWAANTELTMKQLNELVQPDPDAQADADGPAQWSEDNLAWIDPHHSGPARQCDPANADPLDKDGDLYSPMPSTDHNSTGGAGHTRHPIHKSSASHPGSTPQATRPLLPGGTRGKRRQRQGVEDHPPQLHQHPVAMPASVERRTRPGAAGSSEGTTRQKKVADDTVPQGKRATTTTP